jgi:protein translocase SecG subunit
MVFKIIEIVIAVLLITSILLQMQGAGLSSSFGGGGEFYRSRRSLDKLLVWATSILAVLFGLFALILLLPR